MRKTVHVERRFENEHRILDKLATVLPVGQPVPGMSYPAIAEKVGEAAHAVLLAKKTMQDAGILKVTIDYPKGQSGRVATWELTMPLDLAHEELTKEHQRQLHRPSNKSRRRMAQPTQPGNLPSVRLPRIEESRALVQSARQYVKSIEWTRHNLNELKEAGIRIDPSSITVERDELKEHIALVLPMIDHLEQQVQRATEQAETWKAEVVSKSA